MELKDILLHVAIPDPRRLEITVSSEPEKTVRPTELLKQVFGVPDGDIRSAVIRKLKRPAKLDNMAPYL
jgi:hypothetical protein